MVDVKSPGDRGDPSDFDLLPAIDLRGGQVVRLVQGDFARETVYGTRPTDVADAFVQAGAMWIHVVDLNGARLGEPVQTAAIQDVIQSVGVAVKVEVGGGLRDDRSVERVLELGAQRVVLGTAALSDPRFAGRMVQSHGADRVAVALDVRDGLAIGHGWRPGTPGIRIADALTRIADEGVETFVVTAIARDGLLEGPDLDLLRALVDLDRGRIVASGGVSSTADVLAARSAGCRGAIVGRALYEGQLDLALTLRALDRAQAQ